MKKITKTKHTHTHTRRQVHGNMHTGLQLNISNKLGFLKCNAHTIRSESECGDRICKIPDVGCDERCESTGGGQEHGGTLY